MICPKCNNEIPDAAKFCAICGTSFTQPAQSDVPTARLSPFQIPQSRIPTVITQPMQPPQNCGLATASLVLSILGLFTLGLTAIAGIITGAVALGRINRSQGALQGRSMAIAGMAAGGVVIFLMVVIVGIVAAIAVPAFVRFKAKAIQTEAKINLKAMAVAEDMVVIEKNSYAKTFSELGWKPEDLSRYAYFLSPGESVQPQGQNYALPPGVEPFVSAGRFRIVAVSNLDSDPLLDVWQVDEKGIVTNLTDDFEK